MTKRKARVRKIKNRLFELIRQKELKDNRRITQKEIAEFAGVSEHTIINWIRNDMTRYENVVVEAICDFFDCDLCDLIYFDVSYTDEIPEDPDQIRDM
jgi:transcriptional regulator with XRE-family HTH domain